jgi:hypothetical protein
MRLIGIDAKARIHRYDPTDGDCWAVVNVSEPSPRLCMNDNREFRRRILDLSESEARRLGIGKGPLHYLRLRSRCTKPFKAHKTIGQKVMR